MDRSLLVGLGLLWCGVACSTPPSQGPVATASTTPACDWRAGPLFEVVTSGLYLYQTGPLDSIWEQAFPALLPNKDQNYKCVQQVFERGPKTIPGLESDYAQRIAESHRTAPHLQQTGTDVSPVLVFLEPVKGREYLIGKIAEPDWSIHDIAIMSESIWPRRSDVVRQVLLKRLGDRSKPPEGLDRAVSALVRFSENRDFDYVRTRLEWVEPNAARRLGLSLMSKNGDLGPVLKALQSNVGAEYAAAADALLQWGHIDAVCSRLKLATDPTWANGVAGRYTSFRRGDYFESLPDEVIASMRIAPQAWECLPPSIKPSAFNAPRDTTKDRAARWSRTPLGDGEK